MKTKKALSISLLFSFFVFAGIGCKQPDQSYSVPLTVWGVFDDTNKYDAIFRAYTEQHPYIKNITYRKFTNEDYRNDLINALAAGNGPDIFMIHNTWLPEFQDKIAPVPPAIIDEQLYRTHLVDVAAQDGINQGQIYAVPLSVDSLALYYNKDIFNAAGITAPPKTWSDFNDIVKRVTRVDENGNITQSAAAMGTEENVNRSVDLLSVLMMQGGTVMSENGTAKFNNPVRINDEVRTPGKEALSYYTSFARGSSPLYTWNPKQHYSLDAFFEGGTAMTLNYSWHFDTIRAKNAKLNFGVAPLPQIDAENLASQVNYANYWMYVVAKNKEMPADEKLEKENIPVTNDIRIHESWQFLKALTFPYPAEGFTIVNAVSKGAFTIPLPFDFAEEYLSATKKPAARKDIIAKQSSDIQLAPFATGNLIAQSWYHPNATAVERVIADMIRSVNSGELTVDEALKVTEQRASQLMN